MGGFGWIPKEKPHTTGRQEQIRQYIQQMDPAKRRKDCAKVHRSGLGDPLANLRGQKNNWRDPVSGID